MKSFTSFLLTLLTLPALSDDSLTTEPSPTEITLNENTTDNTSPATQALQSFAAGNHDQAVAAAKPLAEKGNPLALYILGFAHETGQGAPQSLDQALSYYRQGTEKSHPDSLYRLALLLISSGQKDRIEEGRALLETHASSDPAVASRLLGEAFLNGQLTGEPAPETALNWWKKAVAANDLPSLLLLARFYDGQFGKTHLNDPKIAHQYYLQAAEKGNPTAMVAAGSRLLNSDLIPRNETEGLKWLDQAIKAKEFSAYLALGDYHENIKKDLKAALSAYSLGSENGQLDCTLRAANMHLNGLGTEKNPTLATSLLQKAAEAGNGQAHFMLAAYQLEQDKPNLSTAYLHLLSAANTSLPAAQNELGLFYLSGKLGVADLSAAASWFTRAAQAGFPNAQNNLAALHERGAGVPQNFDTAGQLYSLAAQQGHPAATLALARFHAVGAGTKQDPERAWALAKLAAERGESENAAPIISEIEKSLSKEQLAAAKKNLEALKVEQTKK